MTFEDYLDEMRANYARLVVIASNFGVIDDDSFCEYVTDEESIEFTIEVKTPKGTILRVYMNTFSDYGLYALRYKEYELTESGFHKFLGFMEGNGYPCYCDWDGNTYGYREAKDKQCEWRRDSKIKK